MLLFSSDQERAQIGPLAAFICAAHFRLADSDTIQLRLQERQVGDASMSVVRIVYMRQLGSCVKC